MQLCSEAKTKDNERLPDDECQAILPLSLTRYQTKRLFLFFGEHLTLLLFLLQHPLDLSLICNHHHHVPFPTSRQHSLIPYLAHLINNSPTISQYHPQLQRFVLALGLQSLRRRKDRRVLETEQNTLVVDAYCAFGYQAFMLVIEHS